jgi:hypothetical protein
MKKTLLILATTIMSLVAYSQTGTPLADLTYTSTDGNMNGLKYAPVNPFSAGQGVYILMGGNGSYTGNDYWDLSSYKGIEIKLSCTADQIGQYMAVRFIMVGNPASAAQSIVKTFTFTSTSQIIKLDFTADVAQTKKLWAIKTPFDGGITGTFSMNIDYLKAVSTFTGLNDVKVDNPDALVNVYNMTGSLIRKNVKSSEVIQELENGLYLIGNKKVLINNKK